MQLGLILLTDEEYINVSESDNLPTMKVYVQIGNIIEAQEKIIGKVKKINCISLNRNIEIDSTFLSVHKRLSNINIKIYHMFFDLT
jgi:uncharacterized protein YkvS